MLGSSARSKKQALQLLAAMADPRPCASKAQVLRLLDARRAAKEQRIVQEYARKLREAEMVGRRPDPAEFESLMQEMLRPKGPGRRRRAPLGQRLNVHAALYTQPTMTQIRRAPKSSGSVQSSPLRLPATRSR